jgi:hypothetical protein
VSVQESCNIWRWWFFTTLVTRFQDFGDAGIAEVLDPKGLRKGMNSQDTNQEDQNANDQTGKFFIFALGL